MFLPKPFVIFFAGLAIVIMLSAAFNYTSLSIATIADEGKGIWHTKIIWSFKRASLIFQILTEAVIIALISLFFAYMILAVAFTCIFRNEVHDSFKD